MNQLAKLLAGTAILTLSASAAAEEFYPYNYGELHLGKIGTSLNSGGQDFNYTSLGGSYGYQFHENIGAEFFATFAVTKETDEFVSSSIGTTVKTSVNAFGGYMVAKTSGRFYVKGKLGLVASQFTYSASGFESESSTDVGLSTGFAVGIQGESVNVELMMLQLPDSDDPLFSSESYENDFVGLNLSFDFD
ncbi:MAG: outer membrane beta-barrel protein [Gammaproteobacteria bacterium]|nr:outer membrane beta-barrel protein [Gammaproteobacteria bacterium]